MSRKLTPIRYDGSEEIFETIIKDGTGRIIGKWKCMKHDYGQVILILKRQYGLNLYIKETKSKNEERQSDRDLDWAK